MMPALAAELLPAPMSWISVAPGAPYFVDEDGAPWHPIGQNDAISWPELEPLFRRRDLPAVERHLCWLRDHGVTCLRLMLEYAQVRHRYIEKPTGRFVWAYASCLPRSIRSGCGCIGGTIRGTRPTAALSPTCRRRCSAVRPATR
jgi:hypothetical protein